MAQRWQRRYAISGVDMGDDGPGHDAGRHGRDAGGVRLLPPLGWVNPAASSPTVNVGSGAGAENPRTMSLIIVMNGRRSLRNVDARHPIFCESYTISENFRT
jgi:hypothetical protein